MPVIELLFAAALALLLVVLVFRLTLIALATENANLLLRGNWTLGDKVHIGLYLVAASAFTYYGIRGMLGWFGYSELSGTLAFVGIFGTLGMLPALERGAMATREAKIRRLADEHLRTYTVYASTPSASAIAERIAEADREYDSLRQAALRLAAQDMASIAARDTKLRAAALADEARRLAMLKQEESAQAAAQAQQAERDSAKAARAAKLAEITQSLPTRRLKDLCDGEEALLSAADIAIAWKPLDLPELKLQLSRNGIAGWLRQLPGVRIKDDAAYQLVQSGTDRDGFCNVTATLGGRPAPLVQTLEFAEATQGALIALWLTNVLPTRLAWGHGYYDRDHTLILTPRELLDCVPELKGLTELPPAGVRIRQDGQKVTVQVLACRPGKGLFDLAGTFAENSWQPSEREVFVWGQGLLY